MLRLIYYDFKSIFFKIQSVLLSLTLFFVGIMYGDAPIEVEYSVHINNTEISVGDTFEWPEGEKSITVYCSCKNVGRPFEGSDLYDPNVGFYRYVNGEKEYLDFWSISVDAIPQPILIKNGDTFNIFRSFIINPDDVPEAGVYNMEVSVYGCKQVFENVLKIV
ncbi:MAG: hypothetical protein IJN88_02035 [Clostridia bacterium]|nr:hypothetical protein [Clostridia bacterium]